MNKIKSVMTGLFAIALVGIAAITFTSCGEDGNASSASREVNANGIISYGSSEPKTGLIPGNTTETGGGIPLDLMFAKLITYNNTDGSVKDEVAKSITPNETQTVFDVKLNEDYKFQNGESVNADSFINAWNYTANAANSQKCASFFAAIKGASAINPDDEDVNLNSLKGKTLEGLEKISDYEFKITLEEPSSVFPFQLGYIAFAPLPKAAFDETGAITEEFANHPIGNGPYVFDHWTHDEEIKVVKNPDYNGPRKAKNGGISFKIYAGNSADTMLNDVISGDLDIDSSTGGARYKLQKDNPDIQWNVHADPTVDAIEVPVYLEHFGQNEEGKLRRQALSLAIDRKSIRELGDGTGKDSSNVCPNVKTISGCDKSVDNKDIITFNPEKAKELWAQADTISSFTTPKLDIYYNADSGGKDSFEAIANSWKNNLGISSEAQATPDFKTLLQLRESYTVKGAYRAGWMPDYPSIENYMGPLYETNASSNTTQFSDPVFDGLLSQGRSASNLNDANALFLKAADYLVDQAVVIYTSEGTRKSAYSKNVKYNLDEVNGWDGYPSLYAFEKLG